MIVVHWLQPNANGSAACGAGDLVELDRDPAFVTCGPCLSIAKASGRFVAPRCARMDTALLDPGFTTSWTWYADRPLRVHSMQVTEGDRAEPCPLTLIDQRVGVRSFYPGIEAHGGVGIGSTYRNDAGRSIVATFRVFVIPLADGYGASHFTHWLNAPPTLKGACGYGVETREPGESVALTGDTSIVDCPGCRTRIETREAIERGEEIPS